MKDWFEKNVPVEEWTVSTGSSWLLSEKMKKMGSTGQNISYFS